MDEITTLEAARRLGVTQRTVVRYIDRGLLPAKRMSRRFYVVRVDDVDAITPGRSPHAPLLTDDFLAAVADQHRTAERAGESPRQRLAAKFDKSLGTVDRWIVAARERGFL